jgi:hypothetical protein
MANVLNRITRQLIASANTPDYPAHDWIINPDLSAVAGRPSQYWVISGDAVALMDAAARAAIDAAELAAQRESVTAQLDQSEDVLRAFMLATLDELNAHAAKTNAILAAINGASSLATLKTAVAAIADYPTRTVAQLRTAVRNKLGS